MGQFLHRGDATTTEAARQAIQHSQASLRAKRYGIEFKDGRQVERTSVADAPTGPKGPQIRRSCPPRKRPLSSLPKACPVAARPFLYALQPTIPRLTRSSSSASATAPGSRGCRRSRGKLRPSASSRPIRSAIFPIDIAEVQTAQGKLYLFVAIDRASKFAVRSARPQGQYAGRARLPRGPCRRRAHRGEIVLADDGILIAPTCKRTDQAQPPSSRPSFEHILSGTRDRPSTDQPQLGPLM